MLAVGHSGSNCDSAYGWIMVPYRRTGEGDHVRESRRQPSVCAVSSRRVVAVEAPLHPREIVVHVFRSPGTVAGCVADRLPITVVRPDDDHRVVGRTTAQRACPRIIHSAAASIPLDYIFGIFLLPFFVRIMTHVVVEAHPFVFGREPVQHRDLIVPGRILASGFKEQHLVSGLRQSRRDGPASGARAHYDVFEFCVRFAHAKSPFLASVACRTISAPCARLRARPSTNRCDRCARSDG